MPTQQHLDGPIGPQNEQPRGAQPAGQIRQQVQRGIVAPVQILQHQQERAADRQHLDRLGQLPQHALLGGPHDPALHRLERRRTEQRGHLGEPRGGLLFQHRQQRRSLGFSTQPAQRLQDRQVGFARAVVLDTLPARQPHIPRARGLLHKGIDHGRLAQPWLAGQKHGLPGPLPDALEPLVQVGELPLASHEQRRGGSGAGRRGRRRWEGGRGDRGEVPDEPIPPPMHRLDEPRGLRRLPQHLAQLANAAGEHGVTHHRLRPDGLQQGLLGDQLTRLRHQQAQHRKDFGGQADHRSPVPHTFVGPVHPPRLVHRTFLCRQGTYGRDP